ncbi:unnamed protein product [Rhizoctonia solani]|uniref:Uncharacterized protein n=1 Tax=Rhizoctonia solani TaxID=456999 RepID=A0A8H3DQS2_9AGAM|nr:unnamed protein product [Rhizoctonia solani]
MFTRAIRPSANVARRVAVPAPRYTSQRTNDPEVLEREKQKNLRGEQNSTHTHAPGWNELLASDSEAHIKADKANSNPEEMAKATLEYVKKQHPDTWTETIREHTNAPYMKDAVEGPLGALAQGAKKAANAFAEAAATSPEEAQGTLSDKGAKAEQARRAALQTPSEEAVSKSRSSPTPLIQNDVPDLFLFL